MNNLTEDEKQWRESVQKCLLKLKDDINDIALILLIMGIGCSCLFIMIINSK